MAGGVLFTAVLAAVGALPSVALLMGSRTAGAGLALNLLIAVVIGLSCAVLFRRCAFDFVSGIGWGACYGFFWWVLGPLTLLPALTGATPRWDPAAIAVNFPALVGHLAYGAALGAVYYSSKGGRTRGGSPATRRRRSESWPGATRPSVQRALAEATLDPDTVTSIRPSEPRFRDTRGTAPPDTPG